MEIINVDESNIEKEHICCAISDKKGENCTALKKTWLRERFKEGLVFKKLNVRGKVFIEFIPAEKAWLPLDAPGYLHINCFWVSGKYKGKGHANDLLNETIGYAKKNGYKGLTVLSSEKKKPFLSDPSYLKHRGFIPVDTAPPWFILYSLPLTDGADLPHFSESCKIGLPDTSGTPQPDTLLFYTDQCPHSEKYALLIAKAAESRGLDLTLKKITTGEQARNAPTPFTTYSLYHKGIFVTNEILSEKRFHKIADSWD